MKVKILKPVKAPSGMWEKLKGVNYHVGSIVNMPDRNTPDLIELGYIEEVKQTK